MTSEQIEKVRARPGYAAKDISGRQFGTLTAVRPTEDRYFGQIVWDCLCDCGERKGVAATHLIRGLVKNCGCKQGRPVPVGDRLKRNCEVDESTGCWNWTAHRAKTGYGTLGIRTGLKQATPCSAHRESYRHFVGPIPLGMNVCHKCDNRRCINPAHLWLGTQKENIQDMLSKGRGRHSKRKTA